MPARQAAKKDGNHNSLFGLAQQVCDAVFDTSAAGNGFPDFVCARNGNVYLVEVKNDQLPPSKRRLTPQEIKFHTVWQRVAPTKVAVVKDDKEFLALVGL
jgi:hypothetical protein